uniref:G patch domain-containing protein 1 n=1 Tax=Ciona intestinalis TaxID=7719 RepID=UPI000180D458|nr:G patch domain-containing protein 1 [Ciona intestinalis]|eukprot:XP_002128144.1 G patch domain-containing protein 1 [Ciona intestinalis]
MSDSDDDHPFAKYGNALKDLEEATSKPSSIPIHEQTVTDEQGRRRFHGAFTGGFSAGYYNSVGSKDGWTPSEFKSTRSNKTGKKTFTPHDFMDTEDVSDFGIAPTLLQAKQNFQHGQKRNLINERQLQVEEKKMTLSLGTELLESLIVPTRSNIGKQLLCKLGWKEGQGIGPRVDRARYQEENEDEIKEQPKVYGCYIPGRSIQSSIEDTFGQEPITFAPKDQMPVKIIAKADLHGLGYSGINPTNALFIKQKKSSGVEARMKSGSKLSIKGQAFGVGAYEEEDEDIYSMDTMENYDRVLTAEANPQDSYGWTKPKAIASSHKVEAIEFNKNEAITGFIPAEKKKFVERKCYSAPKLPPDFDCNRRLKLQHEVNRINEMHLSQPGNFHVPAAVTTAHLTAKERKTMLGNANSKEKYVSVFDFISPDDRNRMEMAKKKPTELGFTAGKNEEPEKLSKPERPTAPLVDPKSLRPFNNNPEKQRRYEQYERAVRQRKTDPYLGIDSDLTEWERNHERHEFSQLAQVYSHLTSSMKSKFTKATDEEQELTTAVKKESSKHVFGIMTRDRIEWHPDPLLCKRFNVPDPFPKSDVVGIAKAVPNFDLPSLKHQGPAERPILEDSELPQNMLKEMQKVSSGSASNEIKKNNDLSEVQSTKDNENDETAEEEERASMDLFKSIFAASSDEESDDENEEQEDDLEEPEKQKVEKVENLSFPPSMPHVFTPVNKKLSINEEPQQSTSDLLKPKESLASQEKNEEKEEDLFGPALPPPRKAGTLNSSKNDDSFSKRHKEKHKSHKSHKKSSKHKKHKKKRNS